MKRILQIGMSSNPGGVENFVMNLYRNLDRKKIQFDFLVDHNSPKIAYEDEIISMGGRIYREYYRRKEIFKEGRKSIKQFFKEHPEITGVHMHANTLNPMFKILQVAKKSKIPVRILHSHNSNYMKKESLKNRIYEIYARTKIKNVTTNLFACSETAGKWMFKKNDFTIIKNGIDINRFLFDEKKRIKIRKELEILDDEYVIGHIGRMNYQKNPMFIIQIFNELLKLSNKYKLLYVGTGELKDTIQKDIKQYGIQDKVIFTGVVNNPEDYFQAMDMFLLPSRFEGFGIVLIEAQANGLYCYTSDKVPRETNVAEMVSFLPIEGSPEEWAKKMHENHVERDLETYEAIEKEGYKINTTVSQIEEIYKGKEIMVI